MRKFLYLILLILFPVAEVMAKTFHWQDTQGSNAVVTYTELPQNPLLAKAFKARFFPGPQRLQDPDFLIQWESSVKISLANKHYYSAVSNGLSIYKDSRGKIVGAHPAKIMEVLTWDLRKNQEITLEQLIDKEQFSKLARLIGDHAQVREAFDPQAHYNFYLRSDGVAFYDPDAPHVAFGVESIVPYAELLPLAAPHSPLLDPGLLKH